MSRPTAGSPDRDQRRSLSPASSTRSATVSGPPRSVPSRPSSLALGNAGPCGRMPRDADAKHRRALHRRLLRGGLRRDAGALGAGPRRLGDRRRRDNGAARRARGVPRSDRGDGPSGGALWGRADPGAGGGGTGPGVADGRGPRRAWRPQTPQLCRTPPADRGRADRRVVDGRRETRRERRLLGIPSRP